MKRVRLKYCGGCNPSYDRVGYVRTIQEAAGDWIEWVFGDQGGLAALLLVSGCDRHCAETAQDERSGCRVMRIKDEHEPPARIVSVLLDEGEQP